MFSGIIETTGVVKNIIKEGSNINFDIQCGFLNEIYIDQSISHNGVCLTVVNIRSDNFTVTAIQETLEKTNLRFLLPGSIINLERSLKADMRLDGHFVQGHVDCIASCIEISDLNGSWLFSFEIDSKYKNHLVDKGSICVNGVSLTVVNPKESIFSVAIIPFTYYHTNFQHLKIGDTVNLEFDILGKYILKYLDNLSKNVQIL